MLDQQLHTEVNIINRTLAAFGIDAGTRPAWSVIAGASYILYGLRTGPAQAIDAIERRLDELAERISASRHTATQIRLRRLPLALEVPHPQPQPLPWVRAHLKLLRSYTMLTGRVYSADGANDDTICLSDHPHVLVAGTTGSGKSTLMRMALISLAINSSPDDLQMVLVDMKNQDLVALAELPHVERFAVLDDSAAAAICYVESILRQRIDRRVDHPRIVLAIDELRELARLPGLVASLSSIVSLGRSLGIHVIAATQHPQASEIGSIVKANFSVRLVGRVVGARHAAAASDRPGTGAELLPGNGAFLRVSGPDIVRLQAYWLNDAGAQGLVEMVRRTWPAPVEFPLPRRAPTVAEATTIQALRAKLPSLNATIVAVYGAKSSDTHRWVSEALAAGGVQ